MIENEGWGKIVLGISIRTLINMLFIFCLVEGFANSYHFSYKLFADLPYKPTVSQDISVTIPEGSNAKSVAKLMDDLGVVDGEYLFLARLYIGKYSSRIQAGSYKLSPSMTPDEICRLICNIQDG